MKIAITGANGRMGKILQKVILASEHQLIAAFDQTGSSSVFKGAEDLTGIDCVIDFSHPSLSMDCVMASAQMGVKMVIGTTGFSQAQLAAMAEAAQKTAILLSPNMGLGINVLLELVRSAAITLGMEYDVEIIEAHHRLKVDAPSGTALKLAEAVEQGRQSSHRVYARQGQVGVRTDEEIGFSAIRGGDIVGDHTVLFAGDGERLELTHRSSNRCNYALGALRAAEFLATKAKGMFDMRQVLFSNAD